MIVGGGEGKFPKSNSIGRLHLRVASVAYLEPEKCNDLDCVVVLEVSFATDHQSVIGKILLTCISRLATLTTLIF